MKLLLAYIGMSIAVIIIGWAIIRSLDEHRMQLSALCADGTDRVVFFSTLDLSKPEKEWMAQQLEGKLCIDHGGAWKRHKRQEY